MGIFERWQMWRCRRLKPGKRCPVSGQWTYSQDPHSQATCVKGEALPPPPRGHRGGYWRLTDPTHHKE
jgi:hypothetical protein